jgi:broad specificity phosphatase PhoE
MNGTGRVPFAVNLAFLALALTVAGCSVGFSTSSGGLGLAAGTRTSAQRATTIYVVRHAEAVRDTSRDPRLSAAGEARAEALRHALEDAGIAAIYVTDYRRSRATAAPLAAVLWIEPTVYDPRDHAALAKKVFAAAGGRAALVVGHSNTVHAIVEALGGPPGPDLAHHENDPIMVVTARGDIVTLARLRYGAANDTTARH